MFDEFEKRAERYKFNHKIVQVSKFGLSAFVDETVLTNNFPLRNEWEKNPLQLEYFGEQLDGFLFTKNGWVQSYGSRCVKPPVIAGDVSRPHDMTVKWSVFAQAQTQKLMKGMLTGPVTILQWSFVRDDQPRWQTAFPDSPGHSR